MVGSKTQYWRAVLVAALALVSINCVSGRMEKKTASSEAGAHGVLQNPGVSPELAWPAIIHETRPWVYWWWHGSAVDPENLAREIQCYSEVGLGVALTEARKRDMDCDMTLGTGWCFGGPTISARDACAKEEQARRQESSRGSAKLGNLSFLFSI
jgi:hypothetical protein